MVGTLFKQLEIFLLLANWSSFSAHKTSPKAVGVGIVEQKTAELDQKQYNFNIS